MYLREGTSPNYGSGGYPGDTEMLTTFDWDDKNVRRVFIRKVYAILMIQLFVTVAIVALFTFCEPVKGYIQANPAWYWASYAVFFVTYLILACCSGPRRHYPWNLILLSIFTLSMAYLTGMLSSYYNTKSVLLCLGITALVCLSVTIFSFQTKYDFTSCQGVLFVMLMVLFFSGIILAIMLPFRYGHESWNMKKADRKKIYSFEMWSWRRVSQIPWTTKKTFTGVLDQIKPQLSLKAKMKLLYFSHIMRRQEALEMTVMLGKVEGIRKRGRPNMRWIDSIKEAIDLSLQDLSKAVGDKMFWKMIHRVVMSWRILADT